MKIIAYIEDKEVIRKILKHLGLWEAKKRLPPKIKSPPTLEDIHDRSGIADHPPFFPDPDYPVEMYIQQ